MKTVPLGAVATVVSGATPKTGNPEFWGGDVPWVTPADLSALEGSTISRTPRTLTAAGLKSCAASLLPPGSVLLSSRAPIGHVAINGVPMATNQGFKSLIPGNELDSKFLYHWLKSHTRLLQSLGNGATFKELSKRVVDAIELPLPPLDEQRRIAAILDLADTVFRSSQQLVELHDEAVTQAFHAMFGSESRRAKIGDFARVASGSTPRRDDPENYEGDIPWVKTGEVSGIIQSTEEAVTPKGVAAARLELYPPGSVVVAMYGQGATRGKSGILGIEATTNQACAVIPPNNQFDSIFLQAQLAVRYEELRGGAEGGNQPNLSGARIKSFEVCFPPIESQRKFAKIVESIGLSRRRALRMSENLDNLRSALRAQAFRGDL